MNEHESLEKRLGVLVAAEPAGSLVDAAYEAGRRDALESLQARRFSLPGSGLRIAAMIVLASGLAALGGVGGFVVGQAQGPGATLPLAQGPQAPAPEPAVETPSHFQTHPDASAPSSRPAPPGLRRVERPNRVVLPWQSPRAMSGSPYSILSMREAVMTPQGIVLDRLPTGTRGGGGTGRGASLEPQNILTPRSIDL